MQMLETSAPALIPNSPASMEDVGLPEEFVAGLIVKVLNQRGSATGFELSDAIALPFPLLDDFIERLQELRLVQVKATKGPTRGEYVFILTSEGRQRAIEELELSRYVGPAPVPLEDFRRWVSLQTIEAKQFAAAEIRQALQGVVLSDAMFDLLGPAVNSGRSLFLYGESGNGKTLLAKQLARLFGERYFVPHSVFVDGSVMIVYDPAQHGYATPVRARDAEFTSNGRAAHAVRQEILREISQHDRRYVEARRPIVVTGGELTLDQLDLQWDGTRRMYQAPPQLKAAGGVLVIDDLGRQRVAVRDILNRLAVPLEQRQDYLTVASGRTVVVPFDCFVIFSTNLEPRSLADDAFLRRIQYKIEIPDPDREEYEQIFRSCCEDREIAFDARAVDYLFQEIYGNRGLSPRKCHPRDVLDHVQDLAAYRGEPVSLKPSMLEPACRSYFLPAN